MKPKVNTVRYRGSTSQRQSEFSEAGYVYYDYDYRENLRYTRSLRTTSTIHEKTWSRFY